jgi:alpha/beta superfamily hydrolase
LDEVTFRTDDGLALEGVIRMPDRDARGGAVVCHSHPLYGGSKDHPLLWALRAELARAGLAVLAFNYRGVMGSEGEHDFGVGEVRDARAAVSSVEERTTGPTLLVGWSFGANVAVREALDDPRVDALVLVGTPLAADRLPNLPPLPSADALAAYKRPVLLLSGERDAFSPPGELRILGRKLPDASVQILPGADHYFAKRERDAAAIVAGFAVERLFGLGA